MPERSPSAAPTEFAPCVTEVDLSAVGHDLCHTCESDGRPLCGIGHRPGLLHEWIEPVKGVCPSCGKRSCPTCDVMADVEDYLS